MTIQEILKSTTHRPWPIPEGSWKFYQEWNNVIFLHWQADIEILQQLVPKEIELDLFEGKPWVSVVAFTMQKIRPKHLPSFPPVSDFDEINIRTYVKSNGKTGVYFLSIEGGNHLSCKIAKRISELPYRFSKMNRTYDSYESYNSEFKDRLSLDYSIGNISKEKDTLDKWLTERYTLFQDSKDAINEFEIHHVEWPIYDLDIQKTDIHYPRFKNLFDRLPDKIQYSTGVQVLAWGKQTKKKIVF